MKGVEVEANAKACKIIFFSFKFTEIDLYSLKTAF